MREAGQKKTQESDEFNLFTVLIWGFQHKVVYILLPFNSLIYSLVICFLNCSEIQIFVGPFRSQYILGSFFSRDPHMACSLHYPFLDCIGAKVGHISGVKRSILGRCFSSTLGTRPTCSSPSSCLGTSLSPAAAEMARLKKPCTFYSQSQSTLSSGPIG